MKNLIFTSIFFLFFSIANGEIVEKIEINGNKRVSTETIKLLTTKQNPIEEK